jgi:dTDP-4-dehydrorhamnose reductase
VDVLVVGGTGLAGRAIVTAATRRGMRVRTLARGGDLVVDVRDDAALGAALNEARAGVVINCAAIVSAPACESDPGEAWRVNARPAAVIADHCRRAGARFVHVSTDHYWTGDGDRPHDEQAPVTLINEYARTKYAAEALALTDPGALVVRTNIVGWPSAGGGSFAEWALGVIRTDAPATLYEDQFVSSLDVWSFAEAVLDLSASPATGVLNVAASEVFSKAELVERLAAAMRRPLSRAKRASVKDQSTPRADSAGLDVSRATALLARPLPGLDQVVAALVARLDDARN